MSARARTLLRSALFAAAVAPAASAAESDARIEAALRERALEAQCRPALPVFCGNIHVACSGRTEVPTFAFTLRAKAGAARIEAGDQGAGIPQLYENARAHWDGDGAYVILRPRAAEGYIKLAADGRYSFRLYARDGAIMSYGECR